MPREMFGEIVEPTTKVGTKQWYTVPLSILAHAAALFALIVVPLLATDALPTPESVMAFMVTPPPPPPPPPPPIPDIPRDEVVPWLSTGSDGSDQDKKDGNGDDIVDLSLLGDDGHGPVDSPVTSGSDPSSWDPINIGPP